MIRPSHPAKQWSGRQMKRNRSKPWQDDPAKPSSKAIIWETTKNEGNLPAAKWSSHRINHSIIKKKWKRTCGKMIRPSHPLGGQIKRNEKKPVAKWSGQDIQQSNHFGDKWKEMKAILWQNAPAKASRKTNIWETNMAKLLCFWAYVSCQYKLMCKSTQASKKAGRAAALFLKVVKWLWHFPQPRFQALGLARWNVKFERQRVILLVLGTVKNEDWGHLSWVGTCPQMETRSCFT